MIGFLFCVAFAIPMSIVANDGPLYFPGALAGAPIATFAYWSFRREGDRPPVVAQTATLITYVATGAGLVVAAMVV